MKRSEFLKKAAILPILSAMPLNTEASTKRTRKSKKSVKFCVFADIHFRPGFPWDTVNTLKQILARAEKENVNFVIECGDFCHNVNTASPMLDLYANFKKPTYHAIGNHDFENVDSIEAVTKAYNMKDGNYYSFDVDNFRFIVLDTNYIKTADGYKHSASATNHEKCHQRNVCITPEQIEMLKEKLSTAKGPCALFSHHPLFYGVGGLANRNEVYDVINTYAKTPVMWVNGHQHRNSLKVLGSVAYFNVNTPTTDWLPKPHKLYPPELLKKHVHVKDSIIFDSPLSAIVTMYEDGTVKIDGMDGGFYMGITREMTDNVKYDPDNLPCDPSILSARFKLAYPYKKG